VTIPESLQYTLSQRAADEVVPVRQLQEPRGLLEHLPGLHGNGPVEAGRLQQRLQVPRQVVAPQHVHLVGHPDVLLQIVVPEVLV
jgi:hypothetical protein